MSSLFDRFSRNANALCSVSLMDALENGYPVALRFDIVEYGRILFSTDDYSEALRSLRVYVGATVVDNGMSA